MLRVTGLTEQLSKFRIGSVFHKVFTVVCIKTILLLTEILMRTKSIFKVGIYSVLCYFQMLFFDNS